MSNITKKEIDKLYPFFQSKQGSFVLSLLALHYLRSSSPRSLHRWATDFYNHLNLMDSDTLDPDTLEIKSYKKFLWTCQAFAPIETIDWEDSQFYETGSFTEWSVLSVDTHPHDVILCEFDEGWVALHVHSETDGTITKEIAYNPLNLELDLETTVPLSWFNLKEETNV